MIDIHRWRKSSETKDASDVSPRARLKGGGSGPMLVLHTFVLI